MKLKILSCVLLGLTSLNINAMSNSLEEESEIRKIISRSIDYKEKDELGKKTCKTSEQKFLSLYENLKNKSEDRFSLIERSIRDIFQYADSIIDTKDYNIFIEGFCDILELFFPAILNCENNPNNLWDYFDFLEDISGVEREEARLTQADMKAINIRLKEKKIQKPNNSDRIFAEIELRREGIIKSKL